MCSGCGLFRGHICYAELEHNVVEAAVSAGLYEILPPETAAATTPGLLSATRLSRHLAIEFVDLVTKPAREEIRLGEDPHRRDEYRR